MTQETIYAAAIRHKGRVCYMMPPKNWKDILDLLELREGERPRWYLAGFVTNDGRYVDREEAAKIAIEAGQVEDVELDDVLLASDLW